MIVKIKCPICGHKKGRMRAKGLICTFCKRLVPDSHKLEEIKPKQEVKKEKKSKIKTFFNKIFGRGE